MRTCRNLIAVVGAVLSLTSTTSQAQYTLFHSFTSGFTDGSVPVSSLTLDGNTLYGMTSVGFSNTVGMLFKINTDGSGYTILTNGIGFDSLIGSLQLSGSTIFGVSAAPGSPALFRINTDGTGYTPLFTFDSGSHPPPVDTLTLDGTTFYGVSSSPDSVFKINSDGTGYTTLYVFGASFNGDGSRPVGELALSGSTLFGVCSAGGTGNAGTVFKINTDGTSYSILHNFSSTDGDPFGSLNLSSSTLYGVTASGLFPFANKLFRINTDGSSYAVLHSFPSQFGSTNEPVGVLTGDLTLQGTTLYGMTFFQGFSAGSTDTVFAINTSGSGFTVLHGFAGAPTDGSRPVGSPVLSSSALFGLTAGGGSNSFGTVFTFPISGTSTGGAPSACLPATQPAQHSVDITRNSRFWFTHGYTNDPTCVTLERALVANGGTLNLGFLCMPTANRNSDNVLDAIDSFIEALGFYYKGSGSTGDHLPAAALCKARKKMAPELIAAIANNALLGTGPENASFKNGGVLTSFPADLIDQAGIVATGFDVAQIKTMTALLRVFNNSGVTNDFPAGLVECSANTRSFLRGIARDATTQVACPSANRTCGNAEVVLFPNTGDPFASAVFKRSVNLSKSTNSVQSASCGIGGRDAVWQVTPAVGASGRQFTVTTDGSNFDTMISVWTGTCDVLTEVACVNNVFGVGGERLSFATDGISTFYIVVEGASGTVGKIAIRITSP